MMTDEAPVRLRPVYEEDSVRIQPLYDDAPVRLQPLYMKRFMYNFWAPLYEDLPVRIHQPLYAEVPECIQHVYKVPESLSPLALWRGSWKTLDPLRRDS